MLPTKSRLERRVDGVCRHKPQPVQIRHYRERLVLVRSFAKTRAQSPEPRNTSAPRRSDTTIGSRSGPDDSWPGSVDSFKITRTNH
jgi:hypothetical protein